MDTNNIMFNLYNVDHNTIFTILLYISTLVTYKCICLSLYIVECLVYIYLL